jgi:hypothetical protein
MQQSAKIFRKPLNFDGHVKSQFSHFLSFRQIPDRVREESSPAEAGLKVFWMPVEDPVFSGDQVRHDGSRTFYGTINFRVRIYIQAFYSNC